jgi:hypothetical protein
LRGVLLNILVLLLERLGPSGSVFGGVGIGLRRRLFVTLHLDIGNRLFLLLEKLW